MHVNVKSSPGGSTRAGITNASKCDYTVYMVRKDSEVVAILVEAKSTRYKIFQHIMAQVIPFAFPLSFVM